MRRLIIWGIRMLRGAYRLVSCGISRELKVLFVYNIGRRPIKFEKGI